MMDQPGIQMLTTICLFRTMFCSTMKFFTLLHTFIRGWDETEFPGLLHAINKKFQMSKKIDKVTKIDYN